MKSQWLSAAFSLGVLAMAAHSAEPTVTFDWFEYVGKDLAKRDMLVSGYYFNPILPGYYPDPSVERVGEKYYLVNSTFAHWPGIPIHESADLVHWKLIGHALTDTSLYNYDGLDTSRGVFAPSIHHHNGTFYVVNTLVDAGGNFVVTAKNPAGPWSAPAWLKNVDGIDPSLMFDDDGKAYLVHNGPPQGKPEYDGHRAIWIHEFDPEKLEARSGKVLIDKGADPAKKPIWIEGPHLYHIKGWYYLMAAEGGTGSDHSEVIFRAKSPWGPFTSYAGNPILTQRDLTNRGDLVTNAGHADIFQAKDGHWWAVFLASRPYEGSRYNTGRETFLLPVEWKRGWPIILRKGEPVPLMRSLKASDRRTNVMAGDLNFRPDPVVKRDDFDGTPSSTEWIQVHVPKQPWYDTTSNPGSLTIHAKNVNLDAMRNPSFLARRQEDMTFDASTELTPPAVPALSAGLAAFQNEMYWYFLGTRQVDGGLQVFLERCAGENRKQYSTATLAPVRTIKLRISADGANYSFFYDAGQGWKALREHDDGSILSTEVAGGFVGTVLGPFARQE